MSSDRKPMYRRDLLLDIQATSQARWNAEKVFEEDAQPEVEDKNKYMVTFPYPYMNGRLHLGHAFSLSKTEFAVGYERLKGKHCLWPFAFHVTGMPIKACADKLAFELETYGNPPVFPEEADADAADSADGNADKPAASSSGGKRKPRSKAKTKGTGKKYQWDIMQALGIAEEDIPAFADAAHWIDYFPPRCQLDMQAFGGKIDWRRSFYTTDANPYYDAFIQWQFRLLKAQDRVKFGKRPCVYSPKDAQPCMDHDRSSGEGVQPQEYTLIKLKLLARPASGVLDAIADDASICLVAGTLRPETMYGQTNCWVGPDLAYGAFALDADAKDIVICTERAARNMAFQDSTAEPGVVNKVADLTGTDLLGLPLSAPLTSYDVVYTLPMLTIKPGKGTGIVTSVPSDAPDDYQALKDLKEKSKLRAKFGITDDMVMPFEPIPIINIPSIGDLSAPIMCEKLKIQSQNDRAKLDEAKETVYKKGFYEGVFIVGDHAGVKVEDAKDAIRAEMLASGSALKYWEPEGKVISRSGDECVVCLADQWYLNYGDPEWKALVERNLAFLNAYHPDTRAKFEATLDWLREWACSRSYGLGTKIPWDTDYLIESLSDSTIYMAYYTIAHMLQGDIGGSGPGSAAVPVELINDAVFNYIFLAGPDSPDIDPAIDRAALDAMRAEFEYWYPVDLRVSGKDLVPNHLTFFMYNHTSIFPEEKWPRAIRVNGHLNLNGDKMSKGTGNFLTLREAIEKYSADATRICLADAGDGLDDANFEEDNANKAILKLTTFIAFVDDFVAGNIPTRQADADVDPATALYDAIFEAHIHRTLNEADASFANAMYREALLVGWHEFASLRTTYQDRLGDVPPRHDLIKAYIEAQTIVVAPFAPHSTEHIWSLLGNESSIMTASWPAPVAPSNEALESDAYINALLRRFHRQIEKARKKAKGKLAASGVIAVAAEFKPWQKDIIEHLASVYSSEPVVGPKGKPSHFPPTRDIAKAINQFESVRSDKAHKKQAMPFAVKLMDTAHTDGPKVLSTSLDYDEMGLITTIKAFLESSFGFPIEVALGTDDKNARPGLPSLLLSEQ